MSKELDIIILSAQFGNGHISVAEAIKEDILERIPEMNVFMCDFYRLTNPKSYRTMYSAYKQLIKNARHVFNAYYYAKENLPFIDAFDTLSLSTYKITERAMNKIKPKIVISTFPAVSGYISKYKAKTGSKVRLFTIITDIVATKEWIYPETDYYCVATPEIKDELILKGVEEQKILVTGIPIRKEFFSSEIEEIEELQSVPTNSKLITFAGGGLGMVPDKYEEYEWLNSIDNLSTIIITGNNEKLNNKLKEELKDLTNIQVLGFTDHMSQILKRTDILVAKPGGITLFEAIVSEVPTVILKPTLGQEKENCKYIEAMELGIVSNSNKDLRELIESALDNKEDLEVYRNKIRQLKCRLNPNELVNTIEKLMEK